MDRSVLTWRSLLVPNDFASRRDSRLGDVRCIGAWLGLLEVSLLEHLKRCFQLTGTPQNEECIVPVPFGPHWSPVLDVVYA